MMGEALLRPEQPSDIAAIFALTERAFAPMTFSDGSEPHIINRLRDADALTISLVAELMGEIVGHIAFSPITIDDQFVDWFGLGPVSVAPEHQKKGIGRQLMDQGLSALKGLGANGCVLLGDPKFYDRFGYVLDHDLIYQPELKDHFQSLTFTGPTPKGWVKFHKAFG